MSWHRGSLRKRITLFIVTGIAIVLTSLGVASHFIIQKNINDTLNKKLALSRIVRNNIDNIIRDNINRLYDISLSGAVDVDAPNSLAEKEAIKSAYRYSIFTDGIFLLDNGGNVIITYPERVRENALNVLSIEPVSRMLSLGKPVVSNLYTVEPTKKKVLYVLVPLRDKNGNIIGAAGGQINPTNPVLIQKLGLVDLGKNEFIDIVDSNGMVIASSSPSRMFTQCDRNSFFSTIISERKERVATCHVCHEARNRKEKLTTIVAFVPLETAPWGVSIQEPERDVFTPSMELKRTFTVLGIIFFVTALLLTIGINRSIVNPLKELIVGTDHIAKGDLSQSISPQGQDEIGVLSRSFEAMRIKLVETRDSITRQNLELEHRVRERTRQIRESQKRSEMLLKKIISSQEDERKRIGRELHDDTLQQLSAVLMRIDMGKLQPQTFTPAKVEELRGIVINSIDSVLAIMQNLRPSLLDDLGLTSAIKSLVDIHLGEKGIQYDVNTMGMTDKRFRPEVEITLFRIVQEAISNIGRHANAKNVFVLIKCDQDAVHVDIEDDGIGFDVSSLYHPTSHDMRDRRGLGILGMKERVLLIGGEMEIYSQPGSGTKIGIRIPLLQAEVKHA
jgi:signal transduction histidine kinase